MKVREDARHFFAELRYYRLLHQPTRVTLFICHTVERHLSSRCKNICLDYNLFSDVIITNQLTIE